MLSRFPLRRSVPLLLGLFALLYTLMLSTLYLPRTLENSLNAWRQHVDQILILVQSSLADHLRHGRTAELESELADLASLEGVRWALVLDDQLAMLGSTRLGLDMQRLDGLEPQALSALVGGTRPAWIDQQQQRFLAVYPLGRVQQHGSTLHEALLVSLDFTSLVQQARQGFWLYLGQTLGILLLLGLILNQLYARLITRRLALVEQAAQRFAVTGQPERAAVEGRDEIARLARNFSRVTRQLHERQQALGDSERLTRELIDIAPVGLLVVDGELRVDQANPASAQLFGCAPNDLQDRRLEHLLVEEDARVRLLATAEGEAVALTGRHQHLPLELRCTPFLRHGQPCYLLLLSDISARLQAEQQLRFLAHYDPLTGLANRHFVVQRLEQLLGAGKPVGMLFVDLDHFKRINDTLGHEVGDQLLVRIARRLQQSLPPDSLLARSGGDEFVVLLETADDQAVLALAEALIAAFQEPILIRQYECTAQLSIGLTSSTNGQSANELLRQADLALYAAKGAGRNRLAAYSPALSEAADQRRQMELDLRRAIDQQEFVLHYQPQVDNQGRPRVMEALLRWQPPGAALVPPGAFIPVLEDTGLIIETTRWVFREACRQARQWAEAGLDWRIAINLSPLDFRQPDLAGCLLAILAEEAPPAGRLELEITESALLDADDDVQETLARLKGAGMPLLLDDFGTGYASLTYLQQFPFDGIKIDRQFVAGLPDSEHSVALVRGILTMAGYLGLHVVAEGVENERQQAFLHLNGCPSLQGYYHGRPAPADTWTARWLPQQGCSARPR